MSPTTGTTGTIRHPDVSEISDLTEGLLSPSRTAEIRSHLDDCALCADVRASLDEIRSLLGTLPGPARMPVDIAGRIDAALAAEALLDATTPHEGTKRPRENGGHTAPEVRPRATDSDVSRETSGARRPRVTRPPKRLRRRRARRRIAVLTGLVSAAACALGIFLFSDLSGTPTQDTSARTGTSSSDTGASTGTYTAQGLQDSVHRLLPPDQGSKTVPGDQNSPYGVENSPPSAGVAPGDRQAPPPSPPASNRPPDAPTPRSPPNAAATGASRSTSSSCRTQATPRTSTPTSSTPPARPPARPPESSC